MIDIKCPECGSSDWKYSGYKPLKKGETVKKQRFLCKDCNKEFLDEDVLDQFPDIDLELLRENIRLAKKTQRFQDSNRIERKAFREYARIDNAVAEYNRELVKILDQYNLAKFTIKHKNYQNEAAGIFHLTDPHFNELVNLAINKYDFNIASKRCKLFVEEAREYFKLKNVRNVLFAMTGDLLNSDRRLDELLAQATNRSKATFLAVRLIELMILDLNKDFNISVANVTGNESRVAKDIAWNDIMATDNYDFTIFNMLRYLFRGSKGIVFLLNDDPMEQIVKVVNKNVLLIHGHQIKKSGVEKAIQGIKGKYAAKGITIHFIISGHLHSSRIGDVFARGSSMVGANEYSERGLQLTSRASQNIHIVYNSNRIDSIKIDLQHTEHIEGYNIETEIEAYNAKSANRIRKKRTIFEVVI
ncbi:MAG: IS1 family transposase [Candidatus Marinimicrobia bacterium]|nr:IS1 family transposase [Candidatus Neomarinimicrobiota bacterium]